MAVICPRCGASNRLLAKFCMKCVTSLSPTTVDREEKVLADMADIGETELSHAVTLQMPLIAARTADGDADRDRSHFNEFAEHALPDGTLIEGFRIVRSIGEGGFGIVYLAWDVALERHVAIKEYMPTSLAVRANPSLEVSMRSDRHRGTFDAGLKSFVNEARLLARFDHPALVKVFRFWEANRTAYMAMPFYEGPTLKATLATAGSAPSESQIRAWLEPLLDALSVLHREHCYHRDISPDNILLTTAGPVLLDFGAARRVISDMTQVLTAVLKPGFAPIEQYGGELQQGPWTDLYALAGVVHCAITGRAPTASVVRVVSDALRPLAMTQADNYSDNFLRAIDIALSVRPEARPQDVAQFRALLDAEEARPVALVPATLDHAVARSTDALGVERTAPDSDHRIGQVDQVERQSSADVAPVSEPIVPLARPSAGRSHRSIYVAAACLLVAGSTIWWSRQGSDPRLSDVVPAASALATSAATPAPVAVVMPSAPPSAFPSSAPSSAPPTYIPPLAVPVVAKTKAMRPSFPVAAERKKAAAVIASVDEPRTATRPEVESESALLRKTAARPPRCADIIQKSSLDTLTADEVAYLKKECR